MKIRKTESRGIGLPFAVKDPESKDYILAKDAVTGEKYYCPECGCRMHVMTSKLGKRYFARNAGEQHKKDLCRKVENSGVWRSFDNLEPLNCIRDMCLATMRRDGRTASGVGNRSGSDTAGVDEDDSDIRILPFRTLAQIAEGMPGFVDGETADGRHRISDFLISFKYAHEVMRGPNYQMGARIIHCRYKTHLNSSKTLIFQLFHTPAKNAPADFAIQFHVSFPDDNLYRYYIGRLTETTVSDSGRCKTDDKKEQDVLIASDDWVFSGRPNCHKICGMKTCGCCYGLYQAVITSPNQIYPMKSKIDNSSDTAQGC